MLSSEDHVRLAYWVNFDWAHCLALRELKGKGAEIDIEDPSQEFFARQLVKHCYYIAFLNARKYVTVKQPARFSNSSHQDVWDEFGKPSTKAIPKATRIKRIGTSLKENRHWACYDLDKDEPLIEVTGNAIRDCRSILALIDPNLKAHFEDVIRESSERAAEMAVHWFKERQAESESDAASS